MKALIWHGDRSLTVEDLSEPVAPPGMVVLDVTMAGICGSDLHGYRGHPGPRVPPLVLGHEAVGRLPGEPTGRYVPYPIAYCGTCPRCLERRENLCANRGLLGLDRPGVFAEQVVVPERDLFPVPAGVPDEVAVLTEPLAVCVSAFREAGVGRGTSVLVIGCGPIGLLAAYHAAALGAEVIAVDGLTGRRAAVAALGIDVRASADELPEAAFDVAIDAVGVGSTAVAAIRAVGRGGTVTLIGLGADEASLPLSRIVREAITVRGHFAYTRADFAAALDALAAAPPPVEWLQSMPLSAGAEGFRRLVDEPDGCMKVLLEVGAVHP